MPEKSLNETRIRVKGGDMIGIESDSRARLAIAREIAESRRAQFVRHRIERRPSASKPSTRPALRLRIRSASRA
jgi:hypothetical protein